MEGGACPRMPHPPAVWLLLKGYKYSARGTRIFFLAWLFCAIWFRAVAPHPKADFFILEGVSHIPQPVGIKFQIFQLSMPVIFFILYRSSANSLDEDSGKLCYDLDSDSGQFCALREYVQLIWASVCSSAQWSNLIKSLFWWISLWPLTGNFYIYSHDKVVLQISRNYWDKWSLAY